MARSTGDGSAIGRMRAVTDNVPGRNHLPSDVDFEYRPGEDIFISSDPAAVTAAWHFRQVLGRFATGVAVVTTISGNEPIGMTCQSFTSVSLDPPLVLFCPARTARTWPLIEKAGTFAINLLSAADQHLSTTMATKGADKFDGIDWRPAGVTGSPLVASASAYIDCRLENVHEAGDHFVVLGRVLALGALASPPGDPTDPLIFFEGRYRRLARD